MKFLEENKSIKILLSKDDDKLRKIWLAEEVNGEVLADLDEDTLTDPLGIVKTPHKNIILKYIKARIEKDA